MLKSTEVTDEHARLGEDDMTTVPPNGAAAGTEGTRRRHRDSSQSYRLDQLGWFGVGLLLLQGIAMLAWSTLLWQRFALGGFDYGIYHQAWWLIAHGHLDPLDTVLGFPFWQNNFELMMWPLALIGAVWSHGPVLLWLQDACLVGAELVIWRWMREATAARSGRQGYGLAGVGLALILANPWAWLSISFDFHMEFVAVLFAVLATYDLAHGRRRAWLWVALTLLCGDAEATWVAGLGLAALLSGQRWRRQGLGLVALGVVWVVLATVVHGDQGGNVVVIYGYLAGARILSNPTLGTLIIGTVTHPGRALSALFGHRVEIWSNLAPGGFIGIVCPWTLGLALPVLLANELLPGQNPFSSPLFQSALLYVVVPLGTVLVLARLCGRWPRLALGLGAIVVVNALVWSVIWAPYIPERWLQVSASSAAVLAKADGLIPSSAQVMASNGVAGRFSDRPLLYPISAPSQRIPLRARDTWWIIAPSVGVETDPSVEEAALVAELAGPLHANLVMRGDGVWVFQWLPPPGQRSLTLPALPTVARGWLFSGAVGQAVIGGPPSTWHLASSGGAGYVLSGDYWRVHPGRYEVSVRIASTLPTDLEVWNATGDALLARHVIPPTDGFETVPIFVDAERVYPHQVFRGWGPFQGGFPGAPYNDQLEVRVWTPGGGIVNVQQIQMRRVRSRRSE